MIEIKSNSFWAFEHEQIAHDANRAKDAEVAERRQVIPPIDRVLLVEHHVFTKRFSHQSTLVDFPRVSDSIPQ